jgi:LCP family protein required for cell wall assembly
MNEHKKFGKPAKAPASIDGIIGDGRRLGAVPARSYHLGRSPSPSQLGSLEARHDGFHPMRQNASGLGGSLKASEAEALLDEPIELDEPADETKAKKAKKQKHYFGSRPSRLRKTLKRLALLIVVAVVVSAGYFGYKVYKTEKDLFHGGGESAALAASVDVNQLNGEGAGRVNVLLLGHDGPGYDGANLTDSMLLASIDPVNHKAVLLSIPRDLWVKIGPGYYQKINAVYEYGMTKSTSKSMAGQEQDGLNYLDKILGPILGITINYHVLLDFQAFQQAVDALGGVTVNVPTELYDPTIAWQNHGNPVIAKPGVQVMGGSQALLYARSRETSTDFARSQRQRALLVSIKEKSLSLGTFSNPIKISDLLDSLGNNVYTDLSFSDTSRLYQIMSQISSANITSLDFVTPPNQLVTTGAMDNLSIVRPLAGLYDYSDIQEFVRSSLPDGFITKENAPIALYNATSHSNAATNEAALLKTYSYNVTTAAAASTTNAASTVLVDLSKGKNPYTKHYLEQRFAVTARSSLPPGSGITPPAGTAFVIILGEDVATTASQN